MNTIKSSRSERGAALIEYCLLSGLSLLLLTVFVGDYQGFSRVFDTVHANLGGQSTSTVIGGISRCTDTSGAQRTTLYIHGQCGELPPPGTLATSAGD